MPFEFRGVAAALLTPRSAEGVVDLEAIERNADFALARGASGVVPGGGTGEYFDLSPEQRKAIVERLVPVARGRGLLIAGIGAATIAEAVDLAHHALEAGADAVLLPGPHFYRYGNDELGQYFREAARAIGGPVILYNLAGFLSPIHEDLAAELLQSEAGIVGIKDSSGTLDILRRLTREGLDCARLQGHDARLAESFREGLVDGAISGPAGVMPEMSAALFRTWGDAPAFARATGFNDEFLDQLQRFPYPWALKWVAERRGLGSPALPFPLSPAQQESKLEFLDWFDAWLDRLEAETAP